MPQRSASHVLQATLHGQQVLRRAIHVSQAFHQRVELRLAQLAHLDHSLVLECGANYAEQVITVLVHQSHLSLVVLGLSQEGQGQQRFQPVTSVLQVNTRLADLLGARNARQACTLDTVPVYARHVLPARSLVGVR